MQTRPTMVGFVSGGPHTATAPPPLFRAERASATVAAGGRDLSAGLPMHKSETLYEFRRLTAMHKQETERGSREEEEILIWSCTCDCTTMEGYYLLASNLGLRRESSCWLRRTVLRRWDYIDR